MQPTLTAEIQRLENDLEGISPEDYRRISRVNRIRIDKGRLLDFNNYSMYHVFLICISVRTFLPQLDARC